MPNSPGAYAFYEKITGNSVAEPSTISLFTQHAKGLATGAEKKSIPTVASDVK